MKERKVILAILLTTVTIFLVFYLFTRDIPMPKNQVMPWQSYLNDSGQTVAFNLVIGKSSLNDAMHLFGTEAKPSLFENKIQKPQLEVFFSSTKVGGIGAKVIINLELNAKQLKRLKNNIKEVEILPTGNKKTNFNLTAESSMFDLKIESLTFIPTADLDKETISNLFGKPNSLEPGEGVEYWYYPHKGLRIIIDEKNKEIMEFYNVK